jgi:hypothetical protein
MGGTLSHLAVTKLQTQNAFLQRWKNTSCNIKYETPSNASVITHEPLTFADRS